MLVLTTVTIYVGWLVHFVLGLGGLRGCWCFMFCCCEICLCWDLVWDWLDFTIGDLLGDWCLLFADLWLVGVALFWGSWFGILVVSAWCVAGFGFWLIMLGCLGLYDCRFCLGVLRLAGGFGWLEMCFACDHVFGGEVGFVLIEELWAVS